MFEAGDLVCLKSGSLPMVVLRYSDENEVLCGWFGQYANAWGDAVPTFQQALIPEIALERSK